MAISRNRLVVAYCESDGRTSGVVSYPFDDRSGTIGEPVTLVEECFAQYGDPKGVTFSADGTEVLVSFTSEKKKSWLEQRCLNFLYMWEKARFRSPVENWHMLRGKPYGERARLKKPPPILENGVLIFEIDEDGVISKTPVRSLIRETFCRLENVHCVDGACAISDTVNHRVYLYDIDSDPDLERPSQVLSENLWLPHAVKFSPNKQFIVVTNFSLKVWRQNILWKVWKKRRTDTIAIFELENDGAKTVTV